MVHPSGRETEVGGYAVTGPEGAAFRVSGGNFDWGWDRGLMEVFGVFIFWGVLSHIR